MILPQVGLLNKHDAVLIYGTEQHNNLGNRTLAADPPDQL